MRTLKWIMLAAMIASVLGSQSAEAQGKKKAKIPPGVEELALGAKAPGFTLPGTDDQMHTLDSLAGEKGTLVIFTCNHCPYAIAYEDRLIDLAKEYQAKGIGVVAISSNDAEVFADDGFEHMKTRAEEKGFVFPYLYDESQAVALEYGPMVTPHIFLFNEDLELAYRGRIDNSAKPAEVESRDLKDAMMALVTGSKIEVTDTKEFGCSIKWKQSVLKTGKVAGTESTKKAEKKG